MASAGQITTFNGRRCTKVARSGGANSQQSTTSSSTSSSSTSTSSTSQAQSSSSSSSSSSSLNPTSAITTFFTTSTSTSITQKPTLITTSTNLPQPAPSPPPPPNPAPAAAAAAAAPAPAPPGAAAQAGPPAAAPAPAQAPAAAPAAANPPAAPSSQASAPAPSPPASSQAPDVGAAQAASTTQDSTSASPPPNSAPAVSPQQSAFSALPDLLPTSASTDVSPVASASGSSSTDPLSSLVSSPGSALTTPLQPLVASATSSGAIGPSNTSAIAGKLPASLVPAGNDGSTTGEHDPTNHDPTADNQHSGPNGKTVAITAGSISGALGLLMIGALLFFCMKRRARRGGMIEVHSPTFAEKRGGGRSSFGGSKMGRLVSNRWASLSVLKKPFHRRSASRVGLTEDAEVYPPMRAVGAQQYRNRRSRSEPRQSAAWRTPPSKPIATDEANVGRPRSIDSPGQINNYQIPWDPNSDSNTPVQKTLRVVNSEIENSPNPGGLLSSVDDSFYGLQVPAKAAAPGFASHRRSVSLQPQSEDPFRDSPEQGGAVNGFDWLRDDSGTIGRAVSQGPGSNAASSYYGTRYSSRRTSSRGSGDRVGFERASVDLANAIAISRQSSLSYTKNPFPEQPTAAREPYRDYASNRTSRSSVSSITSSILSEAVAGYGAASSSNSSTVKGSPITTPSRNTSDASRASYDPFKYEPTPYKPPAAAAGGLARADSRASSISGRSAPPSTVFDEKTAATFAAFGEPGPTRPGTEAYPAFTMLNGPMAGDGVPDGLNVPPTRRTTRVSNDPFDLDCPEVLGYRSGLGLLGRSDSNAGKRGTAGYGRRRSSIQEWRYLDTVEERSLKSDVSRS